MEPNKTHGATLPQQKLTQSAEGCPSGPRPEDLLQGGHEGANPHAGTRVANYDAVETATAGILQPPGMSASTLGDESGPSNIKILTRLEAFKIFKNLSNSEQINRLIGYFDEDSDLSVPTNELPQYISRFMAKCMSKLDKNNSRNMNRFYNKHKSWLNKVFLSAMPKSTKSNQIIPQIIQPNYEDLSSRQQSRLSKQLTIDLQNEPKAKRIKAFATSFGESATKGTSKNMEAIITACLEGETTVSKKILDSLNQPQKPYTPIEALAVLIDRKMTVDTYNFLHSDLQHRGFAAFPPYHQVQEARKTCHPKDIKITEQDAFVPLQNLVQHTFDRLLNIYDELFITVCEKIATENLECTFYINWGFDGSSGQSLYKQCFEDDDRASEGVGLFATTIVPLQIVTNSNQVIWRNRLCQSYRSCRPLCIQYRKETTDRVLQEEARVEEEIRNLNSLAVKTSKGHTITVNFKFFLAAIDGKILHILKKTPSQLRCPYCGLTSGDFNNIEKVYAAAVDDDEFKHGISPLHAWIRVLEFLLKLGYKNVVKKWRVSKQSAEGHLVEQNKKQIQDKIREKTGLLVDVVKPNSGTTNDGNTARIALSDKNRQTFSEILGLEKWLADDLFTILIVLSTSTFMIDPDKFAYFCRQLAEKYVAAYMWHPMTVTIHKILVHGSQIIKCTNLPMGMLSEQAAESRNKFWRYDREHHTRKSSRCRTMEDLFHRACESSDPVVSNIIQMTQRKTVKNKDPLPASALNLLKIPNYEAFRVLESGQSESTSENEDDDSKYVLDEETGLFHQ